MKLNEEKELYSNFEENTENNESIEYIIFIRYLKDLYLMKNL